jgi:hypothetical protein
LNYQYPVAFRSWCGELATYRAQLFFKLPSLVSSLPRRHTSMCSSWFPVDYRWFFLALLVKHKWRDLSTGTLSSTTVNKLPFLVS